MTNKVSFIIQFKDKFSRTSAAVRRQFKGIDRDSAAAGRQIKKMTDKSSRGIKRLSSVAAVQFKKITTAAKAVSFAGIERGAKRATDKIKSMQLQARKVGKKATVAGGAGTAAFTLPAALLGKSLVDAASDAQETANKFDVVFGEKLKGKARKVASSFAENFGVANSTAQEMIGNTADLMVGFEATEAQALKMAGGIATASADLASFKNISGGAEEVARRITTGMTGETEGLKALGVVVVQTTKKFKADVKAKMRLNKVNAQLAKGQVIFDLIMAQSKKSVGDVKRTFDDYANSSRRAAEKTKELKESFGVILLPAAEKLTLAYIELTEWLGKLDPATKKIIIAMTITTALIPPLILLVGGLAFAFGLLTAPIALAVAAIAGFIALGTLVLLNWDAVIGTLKLMWADFSASVLSIVDDISNAFTAMWEGRFLDSLKFAVSAGVKYLNALLLPLSAVSDVLGFGTIKVPQISTPAAPSAPVVAANGTLDGQITVAAAPGSEVKSTKLTNKSSGLNVGMNMRAL